MLFIHNGPTIFMSRNYRITVCVNSYYRIISINIPIFTFSDDFVCLFDFSFAAIQYIVGLQIKVSPDSLYP